MNPAPAFADSHGLSSAPLLASGLPPRILAALRSAGLTRLGDLGAPLPATPKLDADDRALLERVAAWISAAAHDRPPPLNLPQWLSLFLPSRLVDTLQIHYGLLDPAAALALHEARLRHTGHKLGVTRERARQLLKLAFSTLRQSLPLAAAEPLFRTAESTLHAAGGALDAPTLASTNHPAWGGSSPVGAFLLLAHLQPDRLVLYRDLFSEFPDTRLDRLEKALRDRLASVPGLRPAADLAAALPTSVRLPGQPSAEPLLLLLLRHLPDTLATRDGRAGLAARDGAELLCEILSRSGESSLPKLTQAFNALVQPECRRGSGFLRDLLQRDPRIRKTAPGRYALPAGLQTGLDL